MVMTANDMQGQGSRRQVMLCYEQLYKAMIAKDTAMLDRLLDSSFVLTHMTGVKQTKEEYIDAIADSTLNYYSATTVSMDVEMEGERAVMRGRSRVEAAVYGGSRRMWRLQLVFVLRLMEGEWRFVESSASMF